MPDPVSLAAVRKLTLPSWLPVAVLFAGYVGYNEFLRRPAAPADPAEAASADSAAWKLGKAHAAKLVPAYAEAIDQAAGSKYKTGSESADAMAAAIADALKAIADEPAAAIEDRVGDVGETWKDRENRVAASFLKSFARGMRGQK